MINNYTFVINLVIRSWNFNYYKRHSTMIFKDDDAIKSPIDDKLGYSSFAYYLAKCIIRLPKLANSYIIGINGAWGDGKTSMINMAMFYLKYLDKNPELRQDVIDKKIKDQELDEVIDPKNGKIRQLLKALFLLFFALFSFFLAYDFNFLGIFKKLNFFWINNIINFLKVLANYEYAQIIHRVLNKSFIKYPLEISLKIIFLAIMLLVIYKLAIKIFIYIEKLWKRKIIKTKKEQIVKIEFNPWNFTKPDDLLKEFFKLLSSKLTENEFNSDLREAGKLISLYAGIINKDFSKFDNIIKYFSDNKNLFETKSKIRNYLENSNEKIIIIIDDVDRMDSQEIKLIFQLVKLIADFPNIVYILSFDRTIVEKVLDDSNKGIIGNDYLEKIIQLEKHLPIITKDKLKEYFLSEIMDIIKDHPTFNEAALNNLYDNGLEDSYFKNLRDIKRFLNSFKFIYQAYIEEYINIIDLIGISAIELFEPEAYSFIKKYKKSLCYRDDKIFEDSFKEIEKYNKNLIKLLFPNSINGYLEAQKSTEARRSLILSAKVSEIFNEQTNFEYKRIRNIDFFNSYFKMGLDEHFLSIEERKHLINVLYEPIKYRETFNRIYKSNPQKIEDYFHYLVSSESISIKTRNNLLQLIKNFISFDNETFLAYTSYQKHDFNKVDFFIKLIEFYNSENTNIQITQDDIYKLIMEVTENFGKDYNNIFFILIMSGILILPDKSSIKFKNIEYINNIKERISRLLNEFSGTFYELRNIYLILLFLEDLGFKDFVSNYIDSLLKKENQIALFNLLTECIVKNFQENYFRFFKTDKLDSLNRLLVNIDETTLSNPEQTIRMNILNKSYDHKWNNLYLLASNYRNNPIIDYAKEIINALIKIKEEGGENLLKIVLTIGNIGDNRSTILCNLIETFETNFRALYEENKQIIDFVLSNKPVN